MTGVSAPLFPMTADLTGWFVIRAVMGMGVCLYMIGGQTALNVFAHENRRAVTTALHAAAFGIGFGVSPVVGTQVYVLFPQLAFIIGGALVLSGLLVVGLMLPESRFSATTRFSRRLVARISLPLHGVFAYGAFEGIVVSMFPLFLLHQNFSVEEIGYAVTLFILGTGVGMLPVSFLGDRWGRGRVLFLISFIGLISILAVTASERRMLIFISSGLIGASVGPIFPLTLAIIGASLKRQEMPSGSALFTAAFSYGCAAGPVVSALMMDHLGERYVFMMINFLLALLIIRILIRPQFLRRRSAAQRGVEPRRRAARRPGHRPGEMPYPANP
jgi:MFS family permease